jgi:hypothetical protein
MNYDPESRRFLLSFLILIYLVRLRKICDGKNRWVKDIFTDLYDFVMPPASLFVYVVYWRAFR